MAENRGGGFGGGGTSGGGASGSWEPAVKCDGQEVGTVLYPNCSEYRGNAAFNYQHATRCSKTCQDVNSVGYWMWAIVACEKDYQLVDGECKLRPCRERRATANGRACCDTGNDGRYDAVTDRCICQNNLDFVIENGRGYCREPIVQEVEEVENIEPVKQYICDELLLTKINSWRTVCADKADIMASINRIEEYCSGTDINADGFAALYGELMELKPETCASDTENDDLSVPEDAYQCDSVLLARVDGWRHKCSGNTDILGVISNIDEYCRQESKNSDAFMRLYNSLIALNPDDCNKVIVDTSKISSKITSIVTELNNIQKGMSTSVWKNQDGGFNTTRLASDSVAGIVLGTVGGVVTSNIIKKNQVSGGLENIMCTIAGQVIGNYGDEIVINAR